MKHLFVIFLFAFFFVCGCSEVIVEDPDETTIVLDNDQRLTSTCYAETYQPMQWEDYSFGHQYFDRLQQISRNKDGIYLAAGVTEIHNLNDTMWIASFGEDISMVTETILPPEDHYGTCVFIREIIALDNGDFLAIFAASETCQTTDCDSFHSLLIRLDSSGEEKWRQEFSHCEAQIIDAVQLATGDILSVGTGSSGDDYPTTLFLMSGNDGTLLNAVAYPDDTTSNSYALVKTAADRIFLVIKSLTISDPYLPLLIVEVEKTGEMSTQPSIVVASDCRNVTDVVPYALGFLVLCQDFDVDFDTLITRYIFHVGKFTENGNPEWFHRFAQFATVFPEGIGSDSNGTIWVAGIQYDGAEVNSDFFVTQINSAGCEARHWTFGDEFDNSTEDIVVAPNGEVIVIGTTSPTDSYEDSDARIIKGIPRE